MSEKTLSEFRKTAEMALDWQARANRAETALAAERKLTAKLTAEVIALCPHTAWVDTLPGFCARCGTSAEDLPRR